MAGGKLFLSYRRDDAAGHAGRLYDRLNARFPGRIFMDVSGLEPGMDFVEEIEQAVGSCQVLIALIGKQWLTIRDATGRRLDRANDFVRLEIATALSRKILVIPVLAGGANMPAAEDLPEDLTSLARRHALEITDPDFDHDVERLIRTLERELGEPEKELLDSRAETQGREEQFSELLVRAQAAIGLEAWVSATQALQAALSFKPNDAETAAKLEWVHQQQKLASLFSKGQKLYESGDKTGALDCFRRVRVMGGNYKGVDTLIGLLQAETASPAAPANPKRLRWIAGGAAATTLVLILIGLLAYEEQPVDPDETSDRPAVELPTGPQTSDPPNPVKQPPPQDPKQAPSEPIETPPADSGKTSRVFFEPVGRWTLSLEHAGPLGVLDIRADRTFTMEIQAGYFNFPASEGFWSYAPAERLLTMSGQNIQGLQFMTLIRIDSQHEDHYHAFIPGSGAVVLSPQ